MGITNVKPGMIRRRDDSNDSQRMKIKLKSADNKSCPDNSDAESEIMIWIDNCHTPHPKLRNPLTSFTQEITETSVPKEDEKVVVKSEEENDPFRIPNNAQISKSRAYSEKQIVSQRLEMIKNSSELTSSTLPTSGMF